MDYSSSSPQPVGVGVSVVVMLIWLALLVVALVAVWKVFAKAGKPGWAAIVPVYNTYVWLNMAGRPWWWLLLLCIPFVNLVVWLVVSLDLAKAFGKSTLFGVLGLWLFSFIGVLILAFGSSKYTAPGSGETPAAA